MLAWLAGHHHSSVRLHFKDVGDGPDA